MMTLGLYVGNRTPTQVITVGAAALWLIAGSHSHQFKFLTHGALNISTGTVLYPYWALTMHVAHTLHKLTSAYVFTRAHHVYYDVLCTRGQ